jgi:hypothetical protein
MIYYKTIQPLSPLAVHCPALREPIALATPEHGASLVLTLLLPLRLGRMSRGRRIRTSLHGRIPRVVAMRRFVTRADIPREHALVRGRGLGRRVGGDDGVGRDGGVGGGQRVAVQAVGLLELVLAHALLALGFGFLGAVGVDGFLGEVVGASAGGDECCPAVAGGGLVGGVVWGAVEMEMEVEVEVYSGKGRSSRQLEGRAAIGSREWKHNCQELPTAAGGDGGGDYRLR